MAINCALYWTDVFVNKNNIFFTVLSYKFGRKDAVNIYIYPQNSFLCFKLHAIVKDKLMQELKNIKKK